MYCGAIQKFVDDILMLCLQRNQNHGGGAIFQ